MTNRGFTLIETIIVVALVAVMSMILADMFVGHNRLYRSETAELNVTGDAHTALDDVDNFVRQANRVLGNYSTYTGGAQVLILQIPSIDGSGQIIASAYDKVVYHLSDGGLYREVFPASGSSRPAQTKKLASNVTDLEFTYDSGTFSDVTAVSTDLTIAENAGHQTRSIVISSKSILRNY